MSRANPLRIVSKPSLFLSLTRLDWFALYLATASVLLFAVSMLMGSPRNMALNAQAQAWLHSRNPDALLNLVLLLFLGFEAFLLLWLWLEFPRRRRTENALRKIHSLQRAIARCSARIVSMAPAELEQGLHTELSRIREMLGVDRICWYQQSEDGSRFVKQQTASVHESLSGRDSFSHANRPWLVSVILRGLPVHVRTLDELPREARVDRESMEPAGLKSFAIVPSSGATGPANALMMTSFTKEIDWDVEIVAQLSVLASVFANAQARKVAQEAGKQSELRFRHLFEEAPIGCCLVDAQGYIKAANTSIHRMLGYSRDELTDKGFWEITAPDDLAKALVYFHELASGVRDFYQFEKRYVRKDGTLIWGRLTVSLLGARTEKEQLVMAMIEDVTEAVRAREQLEQSRRRLTMALEASRMTAWEYNPASGMISWMDRNTVRQAGNLPAGPARFSDVLMQVHPEDRERLQELAERIVNEGGGFSAEFRMFGRDGTIRWMLGKGELLRKEGEKTGRVAGVTIDVSQLKLTQIELTELTKRLMEAQEEERKRISRELHDDIGQRVALLGIELDMVRQLLSEQPLLQQSVERAQQTTGELGTDLHQLSHALHSSKLQYLGLPAALKELCRRIADRHSLAVQLECEQKVTLGEDEALALFRVAQEALNNVVRHSEATRAQVSLSSSATEVRLVVYDDGKGFDPSTRSAGIGLIGMRERLRAVGGEFEIMSSAKCGTEIHAAITLQPRSLGTALQERVGLPS
jgi:PAS domain S-box-containing protein